LIARAGFEAGLKETLDLIYSRNPIIWKIRMFRKTIIHKARSAILREIVSAHGNIIHPYIRFGDRKVCKLPAIF
jgi:hypothetical protein